MQNALPILFSILAYTVATWLIGRSIRAGGKADKNTLASRAANLAASIALISHLIHAYNTSLLGNSLNFSLSSMVVLVSAILVLIYYLGSLAMPIRRLGVLVFPLSIVCLLFSYFWPSQLDTTQLGGALAAHVLVSIIAYSLLAIAAIQAVLFLYQERQLKKRSTPAMLMALPPLQTMETLLFRLIWVGFALLSLTLLSGAVFSKEIFDVAFAFNHHTVLAILGWCVFATLLIKRAKYNMQGTQAVAWTIAGFVLIQLGYFGTKVVSESLGVQ